MENFNTMAENFDTARRIERAKWTVKAMRTRIERRNGLSAMEYGCGTGLVGMELAKDFESICFIDSSPGMLEQVDKKIKSLGLTTASTLCCDIMEEAINAHFDYIFASLVLHHIDDTQGILTRLLDLLNPGGHLVVVDLDKEDGGFHAKYPDFRGHNGYCQSELIELAREVGFSGAYVETFYHGSKEHAGKVSAYSLFVFDGQK